MNAKIQKKMDLFLKKFQASNFEKKIEDLNLFEIVLRLLKNRSAKIPRPLLSLVHVWG